MQRSHLNYNYKIRPISDGYSFSIDIYYILGFHLHIVYQKTNNLCSCLLDIYIRDNFSMVSDDFFLVFFFYWCPLNIFDYSKMFSGHQYFSKEYYIFVLTYTLFWHTLQRTFVADSKSKSKELWQRQVFST